MVSERQAGFELKTVAVCSEGAVEMLAVTLLSMDAVRGCTATIVLRLACKQRYGNVCTDGGG